VCAYLIKEGDRPIIRVHALPSAAIALQAAATLFIIYCRLIIRSRSNLDELSCQDTKYFSRYRSARQSRIAKMSHMIDRRGSTLYETLTS